MLSRSSCGALLAALLAAGGAGAFLGTPGFQAPAGAPDAPAGREAYKDARSHRRHYFGAGREDPEPEGLNDVAIGYFGPGDPDHPEGGTAWLAVNMAVEDANREGGYKGLEFRLVQGWSENPWAGGISRVARMAYLERVWAILGGIDGSTAHLAEQVVAKALLPLLDAASTDKTVNMANVPWIFSCTPADPVQVEVLGKDLLAEAPGSFVILSATDHDSRALAADFKAFLSRKLAAPRQHLEFPAGAQQTAALASQTAASGVKAAVVLAGATDSARLVRELRQRNKELLVFGGSSMTRRAFLRDAGAAAEGVRVPLLFDPAAAASFAARFREKHGFEPDYAALHAYDAARMLTASIRKAGLNRVRILDALEALSPWSGVSGTVQWDELGRNRRPVPLGVVRRGQVQPFAGGDRQTQ